MNTDKQQTGLSNRFCHFASGAPLGALLGAFLLTTVAGCSTFGDTSSSRSWTPKLPFGSLAGTDSETPTETPETVDQTTSAVSTAGEGLVDRLSSTNRLVGFVTGTNEDLPKAKRLYQRGDALFKEAVEAPKGTRDGIFSDAAGLFKDAGEEAPGSGLQQDAMFMEGEALFFANELNAARDVFETLQKEFPRNRHSDRAAARLFSISKYWIDVSKSGSDSWYTLNFFDSKRPFRDVDGHAVKVLDQIRYDDPTGKLADDATMAAAAEHIRNEQYETADEFLADLRETFTDSDHLFLAHVLGIRCKLEIYRGPRYSERVLDEAGTLVEQTRRRFPAELREEKYNELVARASAEIDYHKAEKLAFRARYREKQKEFGAARELYRKLLKDHPTTPQADQAREVLAKIEALPASPTKSLAFLAKVFPSSKRSSPLETVESQQTTPEEPTETTGKKLLR